MRGQVTIALAGVEVSLGVAPLRLVHHKPTFRTGHDIFMNKMLRRSARAVAAVAGAGH